MLSEYSRVFTFSVFIYDKKTKQIENGQAPGIDVANSEPKNESVPNLPEQSAQIAQPQVAQPQVQPQQIQPQPQALNNQMNVPNLGQTISQPMPGQPNQGMVVPASSVVQAVNPSTLAPASDLKPGVEMLDL